MSSPHRSSAVRLAAALAPSLLALGACADDGPTAPATARGGPTFAVSGAGTAMAGPGVYRFSDCVGPAGTPTAFQAQKTQLPPTARFGVSYASAFRLVDGSGVFVVLSFGEGRFSPPGTGTAGIAVVTCKVATSAGTLVYSGFLTGA